jgi:DNA-binding MarR family transcriptional regulator
MSTGEAPSDWDLMIAGQGIAIAAVALNSAVAQVMGLHPSEGLCLWRVTESAEGDPVTAGQLAEITGLTTGAITGIIDRLEAAGLVRRERDVADRRKVLIRPVPERVTALSELFAPMEQEFANLAGGYQPDQLAAILDYQRQSVRIMNAQTTRLRATRQSPSAPPPDA